MSPPRVGYAFFFFQAEDGIRDKLVTGVQTCALPISLACEAWLARAARGHEQCYSRGFMSPSDDRLFTPRFFTMCGFTFTVFLSAFQLLPTAPFRILDRGGSTFAAGPFPGLLSPASAP